MLGFINDFETQRNTNFLRYSKTKQDFQNFIKNSIISKKHIHFAIEYNGSYAGTVSLKNLNYKAKKAEFAFVVLPIFRGFGLGSKALQLIETYGKSIGINIIYLNVFIDNIRAISIYQKAGFVKYFTTYRKNEFQKKLVKLIWMKKII
jgi:RimJ/RimL family protein N-acetyltransferase